MSQQGGQPAGPEDDWWAQLYDDTTGDTGPTSAPDSLDDRFASATGTLASSTAPPPAPAGPPPAPDPFPAQRPASPDHPTATTQGTAPGLLPPAPATPAVPATPEAPGMPDTPAMPAAPTPDAPTAPTAPPTEAGPPAPARPQSPAHLPTHPQPAPQPSRIETPTPDATTAPPAPVPTRPGIPDPRVSNPVSAPAPDTASPLTPAGEDPTRETTPAAEETTPAAAPAPTRLDLPSHPPTPVRHVGTRPPTYDAEPTALPAADPEGLADLVPDTVLDGARYGACTLRAASVRGDSARYRGEPRRDALLTARFGSGEQALLLVAMATGARATPGAHRAAAEACRWIGQAVGRSHARLVEDIRASRRGDLKSGLHRLTDRSLGRLRAEAAEQGLKPEEYTATLRCLLLPAAPDCRVRVFFGVGAGGLFRLRDGVWRDIEPQPAETPGEAVAGRGSPPGGTPQGDRLTLDLGIPAPPEPYEPAPPPPHEPFRFRASVARPGDVLLLCSAGLAEPLRGEPELSRHLGDRWSAAVPPGLAAFLADVQVRVKGYADDRTAAAVWEA
ncbi:protein phosphatase 2C domain-containing protein [Streptomyces sp. NPDC006186]|uniref:protein phosphatase 2C domain-containing protein n=1 Tax=Streptomyces sp. NPDC006186 TaxID=3155248 RepID=UPI0033BE036B